MPFCRLVCAYCDFVTVGGRAHDLPRYTDALLAELALRPAPGELRTIYFGGGTPSLLSPAQVGRIISAAQDRWARVALEEVTLEANPSRREAPDWAGLRAAGVTRISLGVQSLRDEELRALARGHTAGEAREAFAAARAAGFDNVSIDLIYGIPGQSLANWRDGLDAAIALGPDHISCYALQLALAPDEWAAPPGPARCAGASGWPAPGRRARRRAVPAGRGGARRGRLPALRAELVGAARDGSRGTTRRTGRGVRTPASVRGRTRTTVRTSARGTPATSTRTSPPWRAAAGRSRVSTASTRATRAFEAMALGLRRIDGVERGAFAAEFGADPVDRFADGPGGRASTLIEVGADRLRLTPTGRLLASEACLAFLPRLMLFRPSTLKGIADGTVTRAYRTWDRPRVRPGGRQRTPAGVVAFDAVEPVARESLTDADARSAGLADLDELLGLVDRRDRHDLPHRPPPRRPRSARRAARVDARRGRGRRAPPSPGAARPRQPARPVDEAVLRAIADKPGVRAADLAAAFGRERDPFKLDVRKLKELGLTESLRPGYRLSPRGRCACWSRSTRVDTVCDEAYHARQHPLALSALRVPTTERTEGRRWRRNGPRASVPLTGRRSS